MDKRLAGLSRELHRKINLVPPMPRYETRVMNLSPRGDVAAYATLIAALGEFAGEHSLDSDMDRSSATLTSRG
jgi:hypothetical protein